MPDTAEPVKARELASSISTGKVLDLLLGLAACDEVAQSLNDVRAA